MKTEHGSARASLFAGRNLGALLSYHRLALAFAATPLALIAVATTEGLGVAATKDLGATLRADDKAATSTLHQYRSGGHVLGFDSRGYYASNGTYALRVEFVDALSSAPVADAPASTEETAARLGRVTYADLWPGILAEYDAPQGAILRSTWHVAPGADPGAIRLRYNRELSINADGSLSVSFTNGATRETAPVAWQEIDGKRQPVTVAFVALDEQEVTFRVGAYRRDLPLVIDPSLTWNTFLGGSGQDFGTGIATDGSGNVYVSGTSSATWDTPVRAYTLNNDAFAAKLDSAGALTWMTFLGGIGGDSGAGIAVDGSGNVYVVGTTSTASWGAPVDPKVGTGLDGFAAKLDSAGTLIWNTFIAGGASQSGLAIAVDGSAVYVAGDTNASFGTPVRPFTAGGDGWAAKLVASTGVRTWNTFLGGTGSDMSNGIAVDGSGNVYVAGDSTATWDTPVRAYTASTDAWAAKLTSAGALTWMTFLGGSGADDGNGIAVDGSGNVYVAGLSGVSWGSPVRAFTTGADGFAAKLTSAGALTWNTFLGGSATNETGIGVAVDGSGNVFVGGRSNNTWDAPARAFSGADDVWASRVDSAGALIWLMFLGGGGNDNGGSIAVSGGNVYVAGTSNTLSWGTPVRAFTTGPDAWAAKIGDAVCGNGTTEAGEQCDDGNTASGDCCSSTCQFESSGSSCGSPSDTVCDNPDTCNGSGSCQTNNEPATTECRADAGECDVAENCDGAGSCPANAFEPSGTACGSSSDTVCDNPDTCNGAGSCQVNNEPTTTECRADAGECDVAESCDGAGSCPADAFEPSGTACGSSSDTVCDNADTCNGAGSCQTNNEPTTTECRADAGECDVAESCDGAGSCPADAFEPSGTACGSSSDTVCDNADTCNGAGSCQTNNEPTTTECRADAGECDVAESCDGAGSCPADAFEPSGTACGDSSDTECTDPDACNGAGSCQANDAAAGTACGDAGTDCTIQDTCDGAGGCTDNGFEPTGTPCDDGNPATPDGTCNGAGTCAALDHFQCYKAHEPGHENDEDDDLFRARMNGDLQVTLADQFETKLTVVKKANRLCNPTDKNGEGIGDPTAHLVCYYIKDAKGQPKFERRTVTAADQFGERELEIQKITKLCVPSEKDGVASDLLVDHFKCYKAKQKNGGSGFVATGVTLDDQFGMATVNVEAVEEFCNPVDKNGEGILNSDAHLNCYKIVPRDSPHPSVQVDNQFGGTVMNVVSRRTLCVPATKME